MKQLFLTSSFSDVSQQLVPLFEGGIEGKNIAFIDTASKVEEQSHYVQESVNMLENMGAQVTLLDIGTENKETMAEVISTSDLIYVAGGNTFYLLQEMKRSGADHLIKQQIEKGKLYIGESAGSIILAPNIQYIEPMDDATVASELTTYDGLNVISDYPVPHYDSSYLGDCAEKILHTSQGTERFIPIRDTEWLQLVGDQLVVKSSL